MSQRQNKASTRISIPINRLLNNVNFSLLSPSSSSATASSSSNSTNNSSILTSPLTISPTNILQNNSNNNINNNNNNSNINDFEKVDKKLFEKIYKLIDKIVRLCQQDKLNLINSPPYIIDILPDIFSHLQHIQTSYDNKMHILNEIDFFVIFMNNLLTKLEKIVKLFRDGGKKIFDELSNERKDLIKYSLIFSHILAELKSLFPCYVYEGLNFRIAKADAADFWKSNFNEKVIVPWGDFQIRLNNVHEIHIEEADHLRKTIQLTGTKFVSIFEFDVFTRLFQPWNSLLNNWKLLAVVHPAYGAFMTYDEVVKQLQNYIERPGSYLFRLSCTKLGQWAIGYVTSDRKILQTIPQSLVQALIDGERQGIYVYPNGRDIRIDLSQLAVCSAERIKISKEQYDVYCDMGTSFQLCKICSENNKDRKLEPCGHLICSKCLENWQEKNTSAASCPFCRCEIKAFEPIIISPFEFNENKNQQQSSINGILSVNNNNNNININNNDLDDSFDSENHLTPINSTSRTDLMSISLPPPPPLPPLPSRKTTSSIKKSNNADNSLLFFSSNDNDENFIQEDYLKPTDRPIRSQSNDNLIDINDNNSLLLNSQLRSSISSSNSNTVLNLVAPPIPPPPPPPPSTSTSINHTSQRLASPLQSQLLSPPPPPPLTSLMSLIQTKEDINVIKIKIDNEKLVQNLVKLGYDRIKSACALLITNNNLDLAVEILSKYTNK